MKNTLTLIGAIVVGIGVVVAGGIIVKKYFDKTAEKKKAQEEDDLLGYEDLGFDDEDAINWEDIPVEEDEEGVIAESIKELDDLDAEVK